MGVSISELLILLVIAVVLFGTRRLGEVGSDLGAAIKNFRKAVKNPDEKESLPEEASKAIDGEVIARHNEKN